MNKSGLTSFTVMLWLECYCGGSFEFRRAWEANASSVVSDVFNLSLTSSTGHLVVVTFLRRGHLFIADLIKRLAYLSVLYEKMGIGLQRNES